MQWAGVTPDDAGRIAEKSHELSEGPIVSDGVSLATRRFDRGGEVLFTRAIVQYATQSQSVSHSLAQRTVAIRRPALREIGRASCREGCEVRGVWEVLCVKI